MKVLVSLVLPSSCITYPRLPRSYFERIQRRGMEIRQYNASDVMRWAEMIEVPTEEEMDLFDPASKCHKE
ncbi:MAG: hypothetical protein MZV70_17750 [Desulfobacterales bacterium]|nr:hypothetical protein [Desulfobacterales bacterium]